MKTKLFLGLLILSSCTASFVKKEHKIQKSNWLVVSAYTKTTKDSLAVQGATLKFLDNKVAVLSQNNQEIKGTWRIITNYVYDEYGSNYETLKIEIKDKNNQQILIGQSSTFKKNEIIIQGKIENKTRIFKLKMLL